MIEPRLFLDYVRAYLVERPTTAEPSAGSPPVPVHVEEFLGRLEPKRRGAGFERVQGHTRGAVAGPFASLDADPSLGELVYALVRSLRPQVVLETGVASGVTSAYALAGLSDNGSGVLHSVDLPPLALYATGGVGVSIPAELRDRWVYHWGDSKRVLPAVLEQVGQNLRLFIHDSDHRYESMRWELETVADVLAPGGWLVVDDAGHHAAVAEVAGRVGVEPVYVVQPGKGGVTGLIRKPD